jgi:hypothetical protein
MRFEIARIAAARFSHRRVPLSARVPYCYSLLDEREAFVSNRRMECTSESLSMPGGIDQFLGSRPVDDRS